MRTTILIGAAFLMIVGAGLVHGSWTNRWGPSQEMTALAQRIPTLPRELGGWTSEDRKISQRELAMAGAVGHLNRIYVNMNKGLAISVLLLAGHPADISTHTPDACYPSAGFSLGESEPFTLNYGTQGKTAGFQTAIAAKGGANPTNLRIFWTWHSPKGWSAPNDARWVFATEKTLMKLYFVREVGAGNVDPKDDPGKEFMAQMLPLIDQIIADTGPNSDAAAPAVAK